MNIEKENRILKKNIQRLLKQITIHENLKERNDHILKLILNEKLKAEFALEQKNKELYSIIRKLTHDAKSPLNSLENIIKRPISSQIDIDLRLKSIYSRLKTITSEIVQIDGPELQTPECSVQLIDIIDFIKNEINGHHERDIKFKFLIKISKDNQYCTANFDYIKRIIINILNNSIESISHKKGVILIKIDDHFKKHIHLKIQDNGCGIPQSVLNLIGGYKFTRGKENGSGEAIFFAKKAIAEWGGQFVINSIEGKGTIISIRLLKQ